MKTIFAAAGFLITLASAHADSAAAIRVIDGDTVVIGVETIRILNIDTPEIRHAQCDAERRLGLVAKRRLEVLLSTGEPLVRRGDKGRMTDKYGRTLAVLSVGNRDLGDILIAEGLARRWTGKRQPWCD
ncbi:MAG: thermonuclease family protein [Arenimonas sp.]|nr:thermonuclease family protein [Rhizobium sp.]MBW8445361.1 thermonuclease family protein [Arenimonas sp.]